MIVWAVGVTPQGRAQPTRTFHAAFDTAEDAETAVRRFIGSDEGVRALERLPDSVADAGKYQPTEIRQWLGNPASPYWDEA